MIMAAHQPQYLPWLGYFHKMAVCDLFIYLDDVQYKKREFQNRNRIRVKTGWEWLTVPVVTKGRYDQNICDVAVEPGADWRKDHWTALKFAYAHAPHFAALAPAVEKIYAQGWPTLMGVSEALIDFHRGALGIATPLRRASEFRVKTAKTRRLVDLCKAVGAETYLSGAGARDYLEEERFKEAGIRLIYQDFHHPSYAQAYPNFEPYMAALDLIFNHGDKSRAFLMNANAPSGIQ